jgi:hypothetical protein
VARRGARARRRVFVVTRASRVIAARATRVASCAIAARVDERAFASRDALALARPRATLRKPLCRKGLLQTSTRIVKRTPRKGRARRARNAFASIDRRRLGA